MFEPPTTGYEQVSDRTLLIIPPIKGMGPRALMTGQFKFEDGRMFYKSGQVVGFYSTKLVNHKIRHVSAVSVGKYLHCCPR
jgi:hypothetical protein